jgi:hypothetical protein
LGEVRDWIMPLDRKAANFIDLARKGRGGRANSEDGSRRTQQQTAPCHNRDV